MRQPLSLLVSHWEAHETRKGGGDPSCDPGPAGGAERGAWALDGVTPAFQTLRTGLPHRRASWASAPGLVGGPGCCCRVRGACPAGVWGSGEAKSPRLRRHFTRCWRASPLFGLLPSSGAFTCFIRSAPGGPASSRCPFRGTPSALGQCRTLSSNPVEALPVCREGPRPGVLHGLGTAPGCLDDYCRHYPCSLRALAETMSAQGRRASFIIWCTKAPCG